MTTTAAADEQARIMAAPMGGRVRVFARDGRRFVVRAHRVNAQGRADVLATAACTRCGGAGFADKWAATGWNCFDCGGRGTRAVRIPAYTAERTAKLDATAAKNAAKREARAAVIAAERAAAVIARADKLAADPLHARMEAHRDASPFLASLLDQWAARDLSDGQLVAAVAACDRMDQRAADKAARDAANAASDFVGTVGERIDVSGTVEFVKTLRHAGRYESGSQLVKLRTAAGLLVWFRTLSWGSDVEAFTTGQAVTGTATVKDHDTYMDVRQTVLKNARLKAA